MSILGPIGFKTLVIRRDGEEISSPLRSDAVWGDLGLLMAVCPTCKSIPGHDCSCGIYVTLDMFYARSYAEEPGSVLLLIEGCGSIEMYTEGFRAEQGFVTAVVDDGIDPMSQRFAADHFKVEIIDPDVALEAIKEQWKRFGMEWLYGKDYDTRVHSRGVKVS